VETVKAIASNIKMTTVPDNDPNSPVALKVTLKAYMSIDEALHEIMERSKQPRQMPPDEPGASKAYELTGEALARVLEKIHLDKVPLKSKVWHENLDEAQMVVARWIWDKAWKYMGDDKSYEMYEFRYLCDYNINHEMAVMARMALAFAYFMKKYPSENKQRVLMALNALSLGIRADTLPNRKRMADLVEISKFGWITDELLNELI
jgi:hypothetical protein